MGRRNKKGRSITGIIIIDKPTGRSSNHVLQQVKRLFGAKKAGHTGSLDPLATGVLPICLGEATKLSSYLLDADKRYHVTCQLGIITDSGDSDGNVVETMAVPSFTEQMMLNVIEQFKGEQQQVPPMYSALKHKGLPLYKFARQGIEIERKSRYINIYAIALISYTQTSFTLDVCCSKGTYIRTLVEDISHALNTGGHVTVLRRVGAAGYDISGAISLSSLTSLAEKSMTALDDILLPSENALPSWPSVLVDEQQVMALRQGQTVQVSDTFESAKIRLFDQQKIFLGLGEMSENGTVSPKRVFVVDEAS
ncbi:MAG: tRNA pseudouridine55 synthase [Methylophagaceae bacterium]|jgi:tRNA pseudouridine55 synthase